MAWDGTKQAAVDPDNPAANEQIPFSEWNDMVTYLKDKIINKTVNATAIGDDKILVYDLASDTFVFEAQSVVGAINDLTDVTISGVPADNEVLAYDTGSADWINQTAAEAGLATVAGLAAHLPLAGGTLTGTLNMGDQRIDDVDDLLAYDASGILFRDSAGVVCLRVGSTGNGFLSYYDCDMNTHKILNVVDPTSAQDASTKNYDDTHLFAKEAVTSFLDGYIPVYRTVSGKFEMEDAGGSAGLPVVDTTNIIKGSADGTKLVRFEADGLTTGTTRVMTVPDKNITMCDVAEAMLLSGTQSMVGTLDMGGQKLDKCQVVMADGNGSELDLYGGADESAVIALYGKNHSMFAGDIRMYVPNAAGSLIFPALFINGHTDTPIIDIWYGLDMNAKNIDDVGALILNDATELTIAAGVVTVTQSYHTIDTEADAASDDLVEITGGTVGQVLVIRAENSAHTVIVADGSINMELAGNMTLDNVNDTLTLLYTGVHWIELSRSNNGT